MTEVAESTVQWEIIDHNIIPDQYVVYIVDLWDGNRNDPAISIGRYIGVWSFDSLESEERGAFDPDWSKWNPTSYRSRITPEAISWDLLETIKEANNEARRFKQDSEQAADTEHYRYNPGGQRTAQLYKEFLIGIDTLAKSPDDEQAWEMVEAYRTWQAERHEK